MFKFIVTYRAFGHEQSREFNDIDQSFYFTWVADQNDVPWHLQMVPDPDSAGFQMSLGLPLPY